MDKRASPQSAPDRHNEVFRAFEDICNLEADAQRAAIETLAARDPTLAQEVRALLSFDSVEDDLSRPLRFLHDRTVARARAARSNPLLARMRESGPDDPVQVGGYDVLGVLGEGGMGAVFRARDRERRRDVALKTLHVLDDQALPRFKAEFRAAAELSHPNLVSLHELVCVEDTWFFSMTLVEGVDALTWITSGPEPDRPARITRTLGQLAAGLSALHQAGVLHLDVKPSNVLVDDTGRVVLVDFGISSSSHDRDDERAGLRGTPAYLAPELMLGGAATEKCDAYAVGVLLFEALTGHLPFEGRSLEQLVEKCHADSPALPATVDEDLATLCRDLLQRDPEARADIDRVVALRSPDPSERTPGDPAQGSFVGRAVELSRLRAGLDRVAAGDPALVELRGASGIGKSALLAAFCEEARERGAVLRARCRERETLSHKILDGLVDALWVERERWADQGQEDPEDVRALARMFPVLRPLVDEPDPAQEEAGSESPAVIRRRAARALARRLTALADDGPIALVVDDAQWGDADSLRVLEEVLASGLLPRVLVVLAARDAPADPTSGAGIDAAIAALAETVRDHDGHTERVDLGPLEASDAEALAQRLCPDPERAARIATDAAGVPFFVEVLATAEGPDTVEQVIHRHLDALPTPLARLLGVMALATEPLTQATAFQCAAVDLDEYEVIGQLRAARFVRTHGGRPTDPLEIFHDRLRDAIDARIDDDTRASLHANLARALELRGARPATLARHLFGAGELERAGRFALDAADEAMDSLGFDVAADWYETAFTWMVTADAATRYRILRGRADALAAAGRGREAGEAYLEAMKAAPDTERAELQRIAATRFLYSGHFARGNDVLFSLLQRHGISAPRSEPRALLSYAVNMTALRIRGLGFTERPVADVDKRELERLDVMYSVARATSMSSNATAAALFSGFLRRALKVGERLRITYGLTHYAFTLTFNNHPGRNQQGWATFNRAEALARQLDDGEALRAVRMLRGVALTLSCRDREGVELLEGVLEDLQTQRVPSEYERWVAELQLHNSKLYLGQIKDTEARCAEWARECRGRGNLYGAAAASVLEQMAFMFGGDVEGATARCERAMRALPPRPSQLDVLGGMVLGIAIYEHIGCGRGADAHRMLEDAWPRVRRAGYLLMKAARVSYVALRAHAALAALRSAPDDTRARRVAARCAASLRKESPARAGAESARIEAGLLLLDGHHDEAVARLDEAARGFGDGEARLHAASTRWCAAKVRGDTEAAAAANREARADGAVSAAHVASLFVPSRVSSTTSG